MVKRRQQERLYTDDEHNYLRCDIKQDKDIIKGTLFFDKYMKEFKANYIVNTNEPYNSLTAALQKVIDDNNLNIDLEEDISSFF